jgi:Lar family restriction alleviation protein
VSVVNLSLKPCPFCGNSDQAWFDVLTDEEKEYRVRCCKCHADGPIKRFRTTARKAWNQRKRFQSGGDQ